MSCVQHYTRTDRVSRLDFHHGCISSQLVLIKSANVSTVSCVQHYTRTDRVSRLDFHPGFVLGKKNQD